MLEAEFASCDRFERAARLKRARVGHLERGGRVAAAVAVVGRREHREHARPVREREALQAHTMRVLNGLKNGRDCSSASQFASTANATCFTSNPPCCPNEKLNI